MRVISGIYKRRRFDVPHSFKARPTTDFAKENLFNVLSNYMDFEDGIRALDLFARRCVLGQFATGGFFPRLCAANLPWHRGGRFAGVYLEYWLLRNTRLAGRSR